MPRYHLIWLPWQPSSSVAVSGDPGMAYAPFSASVSCSRRMHLADWLRPARIVPGLLMDRRSGRDSLSALIIRFSLKV